MGFMVFVEKQDSKNLPLLEKLTLFILFSRGGQRLPLLEDIHCQPRGNLFMIAILLWCWEQVAINISAAR